MNTKVLGGKGEKIALDYLLERGCRLIAQNFRMRTGEIDLVVMDGGCLCFVEVKTRQGRHVPEEAVSPAKQKKLTRLAKMFMLRQFHRLDMKSRFDVVAVETDAEFSPRVRWLRNAFDAAE